LFYGIISIYIKNKYNILIALKKRILYIILGLMLLSLEGMGQLIYNGFRQAPGYTAPCFDAAPSFLFSGRNSTIYSNSLPPIYTGEYTMTITFTCTAIQTVINFTIIKATPTLSVTNPSLTYTGNAQTATVSSSVAGTFPTALKYNGSTTNPTNAGTYTITADFTPNDAANYNSLIGESAGNFTINKAPVTISGIVLTKVYDGTPNLTSDIGNSGILLADLGDVRLDPIIDPFISKNVSSSYTTTVSINIVSRTNSGKQNNYYIADGSPTLDIVDGSPILNVPGSITARPITLTANTNTKVYDGTLSSTATPTLTGTLASGDVGVYSQTYDSKTQGTSKVLKPTATILDASNESMIGNYSITYTSVNIGVIEKRPITLTANTNTKVYDGTLSSTATPTLTGALASGDVGVYSQTYDTKTQGTSKVLTPTATILDATSASVIGNYSITYTSVNTGVIEKRPITLTANTNTKVYDGTVSSTATPTLTGTLASGDVGVYSQTYDTKTQGTNKKLTPTATILDATNESMIGNYSITYINNSSGVIEKRPITLTANTNTKVYDGTLSSTATPTLTGALASGDVGVYSQTYDTKTQGTNKKLTPTATILDATNASVIGNYSITYASVNTGVIEKLPITLTANTNTKVYDGTLSSTATPTLTGTLASGDVGVYSQTYDTKSQGTNKKLTPTATILDASSTSVIGNYSITYASVNTGVIEKLPITLTANTNTKVYDGTLSSTATPTLTGALASGDVGVYSQTYDTKSQGTNKKLTPTATILDASSTSVIGNYSITYASVNTGVIEKLPIILTASVNTKVYDGNTTATATLTDSRITGDVFTVEKTEATFNNKNIGTGKVVTVSGISLTGTDAGNYTLTSTTATGTASITVKSLIITATALDKVYDGNTNASATLTDNKFSGDDLTVNKTGASFNNKNAGSSKTVTIAGITLTGTDAGNYTLTSTTATGTASITLKSLTITATVSDKQYDGNTTAAVTLSDNRLGNDVLTINKTGSTFNNKNVGVGKTVTINGINLIGTDAGNYSLISSTATGIASITAKNLIVSAIAKNKPYDGNKKAEVILSENKINGDVITSAYTSSEFESSAPGDNKLVYISGISIAGVDAGNYSLTNNTATAYANITGTTKAYDLPNAFTPNGDGKNDKFKIIVNDPTRVNLISFQIYNRNGTLMFTTNKISEGWDGRYKGVMQDMGIYFVKLITLENGLETPRLYLLK
jgi:gliding motility-associated-like protein